MYNCEDIFEKTDAYLDGELSELEYAEFEKHLENCEACRNSVEFAKNLNGVMHGMPSVEPPADFLDNLHKKIGAEGKTVRFYKKWQPYGALAACLILAVVIRTNAVRDLNESSSYLKMTTPEPTTRPTEILNEDVYAPSENSANDIADTETAAYMLNNVLPTAAPTSGETESVTAAAPIQAAPTAQTKADEYVQPLTDAVQVPDVTVTDVESAAPPADVPMMLSIDDENASAAVNDATTSMPVHKTAEESNNAEKTAIAPEAASEAYGGNTVVLGGSAPAAVGTTSSGSDSAGKRTGGSSGASSSSGGGGSASTGGTWISGITASYTAPVPNYISAEYKAEVEALIDSLGIQKKGIYYADRAVFAKFVSALAEKNIPFDGIHDEVDGRVRFDIEWE